MSLLLEALKKAELAKQGNQATSSASSRIELAPAAASAPAKPIITRENLPDITQQLEILSEDLPSSSAPQGLDGMYSLTSQEPIQATTEPSFADKPVEPARNQAAAKQMFEAKGLEDYNPRKPFYYTIGALAVFAAGCIGYFWWQLQPRYIVAPTAVANAPSKPLEPIPPAPAAAAPIDPLASPGPNTAPSTIGASPASAAQDNKAGIQPTKPTIGATQPLTSGPSAPVAITPTPSANAPVTITRSASNPAERATTASTPRQAGGARVTPSASTATRTDQQLELAYDAYQKSDLPVARQAYSDALKLEPSNRDALLGLAAIEARGGQHENAEARYLKLLESDPRDAHALAGLIALRGQADPMQSESRLKNMIATQPEAGFLHFALGNQMALQARWPEAQAAYFKALSNEPDNADYAYNLAVSLDHIRQSKLALEYYQKALALSDARPSTFDRTRATARMRELQR